LKILGIVGGIAPGSTIEYYRLLMEGWRQKMPGRGYPPIIINSIDLDRMLAMVGAQAFGALAQYLLDEIQRLASAGAQLALLASNTPHVVFDTLRERSPLPLISIVEAIYPEVFSGHGMTLLRPSDAEQAFIHEKYMSELVNGVFSSQTRDRILTVADRMRKERGGIPLLDTTKIHVDDALARLLE